MFTLRDEHDKTITSYKSDFMNVLLSYCEDGDVACINAVYKNEELARNIMSQQDPSSGRIQVTYPKGMDDSLKTALEGIFSVLEELEKHNKEEILEKMNDIEAEIHDMESVSVIHKHMALSAVSVGKESLKLWHGVAYGNDDDNDADSNIQHPLRRVLQQISVPVLFLPWVIGADMLGLLMTPVAAIALLATSVPLVATLPVMFPYWLTCIYFPIFPCNLAENVGNLIQVLTLPPQFSRIASENVNDFVDFLPLLFAFNLTGEQPPNP